VVIIIFTWLIIPAVLQSNSILKGLVPSSEIVGSILAIMFGLGALKLFFGRDTPQSSLGPSYKNNMVATPRLEPRETHRPNQWSVSLLREIEWKRFEDLCNVYHRECGLRSETTGLGADGGVDIRLFDRETGKIIGITQCKAWPDGKVGIDQIRQLYGIMAYEKVPNGTFITNGVFTQPAIEWARSSGIILADGEGFIGLLHRLPAEAQIRLLEFATQGDHTTPTCPHCGIKMVLRTGRRQGRKFWACRNFPKCDEKIWPRKNGGTKV
jgi:restriction system protein